MVTGLPPIDPPRLVLCMIVRNEAKIIQRLLNSLVGFIDGLVICDTGSTDGTPLLFQKFAQEHHLESYCCLGSEPFRDFGHNRSFGLSLARHTIEESWHWPLDRTFLLCLDADMTLSRKDPMLGPLTNWSRQILLEADCHMVNQTGGSVIYTNARILRASLPWRALGVTHEYYDAPAHSRRQEEDLLILDWSDGSNRVEKGERDVRLLKQGLIDEPTNGRYMFYLAQTYRDTGQSTRALAMYEKYMQHSTFPEEKWYAMYAKGQCYENLKQWGPALKCYVDAYEYRPIRLEPVMKIITYYRNHGQMRAAWLFVLEALTKPFPKDDALFIQKYDWDVSVLLEGSIAALFNQAKGIGRRCLYALLLHGVPSEWKDLCLGNLQAYLEPYPFYALWKPLQVTLEPEWHPCNPALWYNETAQQLEFYVRCVNYTNRAARHFYTSDPQGLFKSKYKQLIWTPDTMTPGAFTVKEETFVVNEWEGPYKRNARVQGLEDWRLVKVPGQSGWWFTATSIEMKMEFQPTMVMGQLSADGSQVIQVIPLHGYEDNIHQKNWLPFYRDQAIHFIYGYEPLVILRAPHLLDTDCSLAERGQLEVAYRELLGVRQVCGLDYRGSAGPLYLPARQQYLVAVHEVWDQQEFRRYWHRWLLLDRGLTRIEAASAPFFFKHQEGVEIIMSMIGPTSADPEALWLTLSIEDREAYWGRLILSEVLQFIEQTFATQIKRPILSWDQISI